MPAPNDPQIVRQHYITDESLRIRQEIDNKYTIPPENYVEWVLNSMVWRGNEVVLDAGSGIGNYYKVLHEQHPGLKYVGLDFSEGLLGAHPAQSRLVLADAQKPPFAANSFNVIMANHMLYHLPNIDAALVEFQRLLTDDGVLVVATDSTQSMPELQVLMRRAILLLTRSNAAQVQPPRPASDLFALENGTRKLSRYFYAVVRHDLPSKLVFPDIEPVMQYLETTRSMREPQLPEDVSWDDVMMIMRQQITHLVNHLGELVVNKLTGVVIASNRGGFIEEFIQHKG